MPNTTTMINNKITVIRLCYNCGKKCEREINKEYEDYPVAVMCDECHEKERRAESGMLKKHLNMTFDNFLIDERNKDIINKCKLFLNGDKNIYLYGERGVGKTHLACAVANERLKTNRILFYRSIDLTNEIRKSSLEDENLIRKLIIERKCAIFIDDFLKEKVTDFVLEAFHNLFDLIEADCRKGIFLTTEFGIKEVAKVTDSVASRIVGNFEIIKFMGKDRRIK